MDAEDEGARVEHTEEEAGRAGEEEWACGERCYGVGAEDAGEGELGQGGCGGCWSSLCLWRWDGGRGERGRWGECGCGWSGNSAGGGDALSGLLSRR